MGFEEKKSFILILKFKIFRIQIQDNMICIISELFKSCFTFSHLGTLKHLHPFEIPSHAAYEQCQTPVLQSLIQTPAKHDFGYLLLSVRSNSQDTRQRWMNTSEQPEVQTTNVRFGKQRNARNNGEKQKLLKKLTGLYNGPRIHLQVSELLERHSRALESLSGIRMQSDRFGL